MKSAIFARRAREELRDARRWIMADSPRTARRLQAAVSRVAVLLGEQPYLGVERPDLLRAPYRMFVLSAFPYLLVYDPAQRPPRIVRFVHGARDLPTVLAELAPFTDG